MRAPPWARSLKRGPGSATHGVKGSGRGRLASLDTPRLSTPLRPPLGGRPLDLNPPSQTNGPEVRAGCREPETGSTRSSAELGTLHCPMGVPGRGPRKFSGRKPMPARAGPTPVEVARCVFESGPNLAEIWPSAVERGPTLTMSQAKWTETDEGWPGIGQVRTVELGAQEGQGDLAGFVALRVCRGEPVQVLPQQAVGDPLVQGRDLWGDTRARRSGEAQGGEEGEADGAPRAKRLAEVHGGAAPD